MIISLRRYLYSHSKKWPLQLSRDVIQKVEQKWALSISKIGSEIPVSAKKAYILAMFPYPSGNLHMGHVRVYTISDVMARYNFLKGCKVLHPMGWDAFGLPAENAAKERNLDPKYWTQSNISIMQKQLENLCLAIDWSRSFSTTDPSYYKWTQWLFIQLYKNDLAYQRKAKVFWDPVDKTVLAAEQVDENGCSWRSGAKVEHKYLKQWFFRTTAFAKDLKDNLDTLNPSFWKEVIELQRGWIGKCDGCRVEFKVIDPTEGDSEHETISVFTRTPELLYGATHIVLSRDHRFSGRHDRLEAVNPLSGNKMSFVLDPGTELEPDVDSRLVIPCLGIEFDQKLAQGPNVLSEDKETVINSGPDISNKHRKDAFERVCQKLRSSRRGGYQTSAKLDDWLISRQRYWGTPIPIVHCPDCGIQPVNECDIPVKLVDSSSDAQEHCECPKCGSLQAYRETDTLDTFVDSAWYFLRFADPHNNDEIFNKSLVNEWLPVDVYVGGREHAIMHLYFARFICFFLYNIGILNFREPFTKLLTQGMVYGRTYKKASNNQYLRPDEMIETKPNKFSCRDTGEAVSVSWEKMSKSKYNGVDPQAVLGKYGVDSVRACIVANVAPKSVRKWSEDQFIGIENWKRKVWTLFGSYLENVVKNVEVDAFDLIEQERIIREARNYFVKEVSFHMEVTYLLNTAIARLQGLTTSLRKVPSKCHSHSAEFLRALSDLTVMMSPFMPCLTHEMWHAFVDFAKTNDIILTRDPEIPLYRQPWPTLDSDYIMSLVVKVGSVEVGALPLSYSELDVLTPELAAELVLKSDLINSPSMLKAAGVDFISSKYSYLYEKNYRGVINFAK